MKKFKINTILIIFISLIYLLTLKGAVGNYDLDTLEITNKPPFETSQERGRYAQIINLANTQSPILDNIYAYLTPDLAWYNGHFYSAFPIGLALTAIPLYSLGKLINLAQITSFMTTTIFSILCAILLFNICKKIKFKDRTSVFVVIIFSLASVVWTYSVTLSAHTLSALLILISLNAFLNLAVDRKNYIDFTILGICFGINLFVDYPNLVILLPILIISSIKITNIQIIGNGIDEDKNINVRIPVELIVGVLAFLLPFALFISYSKTYYGKTFAFTNIYNIKFLETKIQSYSELTNELVDSRNYSTKFSIEKTLNGMHVLFTSTDRGLFVFFPVLLFAIPGIIALYKKNINLTFVCFFTVAFNALVYGSYDDPWGGWAFGSRYMIASLPLFCILCGAGFEFLTKKHKALYILIIPLLFISISVASLGALTTAAVPPSVEIQNTNIHQNYLYNVEYLKRNGVSSFAYNSLFNKFLSPTIYYVVITFSAIAGASYILKKASH